jgi:hypothetical protein
MRAGGMPALGKVPSAVCDEARRGRMEGMKPCGYTRIAQLQVSEMIVA